MSRILFALLACVFTASLSLDARAQSASPIAGLWRFDVEYQDERFAGLMTVSDAGDLAKIVILGEGGRHVVELARVSTSGDAVEIDGYEVVHSQGPWSADNFSLRREGERMVGNSRDDDGGFVLPVTFIR